MERVTTSWGIFEVGVGNTICPDCGCVEHSFRPLESNKSIQVRCSACGRWLLNARYDRRSKEQIRKDKIHEWVQRREGGESHGCPT